MGEDAHYDGNFNTSLIGADEAGQTRRILVGSGGNLNIRFRDGVAKGFARLDPATESINAGETATI